MSQELPSALPEQWLVWAQKEEVWNAWMNQLNKDLSFEVPESKDQDAGHRFTEVHAALQLHLEANADKQAQWLYRADIPEDWLLNCADSYRLSLIVLYRTLQKVILRMQYAGRL